MTATDPYGLDGPHHYEGLRFVPVPGNHRALARMGDDAGVLAQATAPAVDVLGRVGQTEWTGDDADAFRTRVGEVPTVLAGYAVLLRKFAMRVDEAATILRLGKGRAEQLDREAAVVRRTLAESHRDGMLPTRRSAADRLAVAEAEYRGEVLMDEANRLRDHTSARLSGIADEIHRLSRQAPNAPERAAAGIVDRVAEALGRTAPLGLRFLTDEFPDEMNLVGDTLGDVSGLASYVPGYGSAVSSVTGGLSLGIKARLYRTGATNSRGEALETRADVATATIGLIPLFARLGPLRVLTTGLSGVGGTASGNPRPPRVPMTPLEGAVEFAARSAVPLVAPVAQYAQNKGFADPPPPEPEVRLQTIPLPRCDAVTPEGRPPGRSAPR